MADTKAQSRETEPRAADTRSERAPVAVEPAEGEQPVAPGAGVRVVYKNRYFHWSPDGTDGVAQHHHTTRSREQDQRA